MMHVHGRSPVLTASALTGWMGAAVVMAVLVTVTGCGSAGSWDRDAEPRTSSRSSVAQQVVPPALLPLDPAEEMEELWIIAARGATDLFRGCERVSTLDTVAEPREVLGHSIGSGTLLVRPAHQSDGLWSRLAVESTEVNARVLGPVAAVRVDQYFDNPLSEPVEACYAFPLPEGTAVHDFIVTIGDRRIRAIVRPVRQAQRIYETAISSGRRVSLLTQETNGLFLQRISQIQPGESVSVELCYLHALPFSDGWHTFALPLRRSLRDTVLQLPRSGKSSVHITLDSGIPIDQIVSLHHRLLAGYEGQRRILVLDEDHPAPDADMIVRFRLAQPHPTASMMTYRDLDGAGYFALTLYPQRGQVGGWMLEESERVTDVVATVPATRQTGRAAMIVGRVRGEWPSQLVLVAAHDSSSTMVLPFGPTVLREEPLVRTIWAQQRLASLTHRMGLAERAGDDTAAQDLLDEVLELSLSHTLISSTTAMIAVDAAGRIEPLDSDHGLP